MKFPRLAGVAAPLVLASTFSLLAPSSAHAGNPLAPIWTGVYVGFQGGMNWSDLDTSFNSFNTSAVSGGGHVGFNLGLGPVVVGIEADATLDDVSFAYSTAGGGSQNFDTDWSGTLRGRIGIPIGPALFYATAGYAWTDVSISGQSGGGTSFSGDHRFDGVVYGIGAEAYVFPNMSVRLEALRFDYSSDRLSFSGATGGAEEFDPSDTVVRAGITFHLN